MVDISLEILASSVPIQTGYLARYRVKTWWCHIDVPPDVTFIKLPRLPMIQPFLIMTGKDTTLFIETWQDSQSCIIGGGGGDGGLPLNKTMFLGMTTCHVDEQLKTPNLNPSVQWVDVHNPVENLGKGKLLVKIDARFCPMSSSENSNGGAGVPSPLSPTNQDSPIKMVQSPRRNQSNIYFDNLNGYGGGGGPSSIQNVASRKSDTSVYSIASSTSTTKGTCGGREQGIQTELSMDKITTYHRDQDRQKDNLSPLEAAKKFLRREALPPKVPLRGEGTGGDGDGGNKRAYQLEESVEQVIDILNNARIEDPPPPRPPQHHGRILGVTKVGGLPSLEVVGSSGGSSKRVSISSTTSTTTSQDNQFIHQNLHVHGLSVDDKPLTRFKEVHFDGNKAKEQASKVLVMTRHTAQVPQHGQRSSGPPVVTRRRIAAAIFND